MRRARDRHGRGLRGPLTPPEVPLARSRGERFDDLVLDAVEHVEPRFVERLDGIEFAVEDVPPPAAPDAETLCVNGVTLARLVRRRTGPDRLVVYRRPLELRAPEPGQLADVVHDVVVEEIANLLGLDPETVDPGYQDDG